MLSRPLSEHIAVLMREALTGRTTAGEYVKAVDAVLLHLGLTQITYHWPIQMQGRSPREAAAWVLEQYRKAYPEG